MHYILYILSIIYTAPPNFTLSLNGTVLIASWDAPALQNVSYILTCSVDSNEVLSLSTTLTDVVVGIYMTEATYSCNVYATISGVNTPATDNKSVITGGRPKHLKLQYLKTTKCISVCFVPDSSEPAYLPFIPRLNEDNVITTGLDVEVPVTFPFGNASFTGLYVSNIITVYPWCFNASPHTPSICFKVCMIVQLTCVCDTFNIFRLEAMELYHLDLSIMIPTTQPLQVPSLDYI